MAVSVGSPEQASVPLPALFSMPSVTVVPLSDVTTLPAESSTLTLMLWGAPTAAVTGPAVKASLLGGPGAAVAGSAPRPTPANAPTSATVTAPPMRRRRRGCRPIPVPAPWWLWLLAVTSSPVDWRGPGRGSSSHSGRSRRGLECREDRVVDGQGTTEDGPAGEPAQPERQVGRDGGRQRGGRVHEEHRAAHHPHIPTPRQGVLERRAGRHPEDGGRPEEAGGDGGRGGEQVGARHVDGGGVGPAGGQRPTDRVADARVERAEIGGGLGRLDVAVGEQDRAVGGDGGRDGREGVEEVEPGGLEHRRRVAHLLGDVDRRGELVAPGLAHHRVAEVGELVVDHGAEGEIAS